MTRVTRPAFLLLALLISPVLLAAQDTQFPPSSPPPLRIDIPALPAAVPGKGNDFENWFMEFTPGIWEFNPTGTVTSQSISSNMKNDLGIEGWKTLLNGRFTARSGRNKVAIEGTRYELNGALTVQQTVTVDGRTISLDDVTQSNIKLNYVYVGYQRDFLVGRYGFLGATAGATYLQSNAHLTDVTRMVTQYFLDRGTFPVLGGAARLLPFHSYPFYVSAESKGMNLGNNGFYLHSDANFGFSPTPNFSIQAGYARMGMDLHSKYDVSGLRSVFKGPVASVTWRLRM
jgi:hypothetical protein